MSVLTTASFVLIVTSLQAADVRRFLEPKAWQCTFEARLSKDVQETTGPAGMAHDPKRQLFKALGKTGIKMDSPSGETDSYHESMEQYVQGQVRLHHVYDGDLDGIQIAAWNNGSAEVRINNTFKGSEQNKTIFRDKQITFNGTARFEGEIYEPPFQIWIYPDQGVYALQYHLSPVRGTQVEHCRMKAGMEGDRKKLESASDRDMPLGSFFSGLTKVTCATERQSEIEIDGGVMSALIEDVKLPGGMILEGSEKDQFSGSLVKWSCRPE